MTTPSTRIGARGPVIFPLVFGGNVFGWTADRDASYRLLDAFVAAGGTMVDTAEGYSVWAPGNDGYESERIIGEWIRSRAPEGFQVATKVGGHRQRRDLDPAHVLASVDESRERLGVASIDLYWAHFDDPAVPIAEQVDVFQSIVASGKAKAIGLSNYTPERLAEWMAAAEASGGAVPVAFQPHYNLVHRVDTERDVVPIAEAHGVGLLPYYSLASGFLAGKYRSTDAGGDSPRAGAAAAYATPRNLRIIDALERIGAAHDAGIASTALAWLRRQPTVAAPIASASRPEQIAGLMASASLELAPEELAELDRLSAGE